MTCCCCRQPTIEDRIVEMVQIIRTIPGTQCGWEEIRAANDQYAEVGRHAEIILRDLAQLLEGKFNDED